MRRHGIAEAAAGGSAVHFGMALWPYDVLLRFAYDLPEHEHRWEGRWFDDRFETAALAVRASASKVLIALTRMDQARQRLTAALDGSAGGGPSFAELRTAVEAGPIEIDLVIGYLHRLVDEIAAVVPCCFGIDGRAMAADRRSLAALVDSEVLRKSDEILADLLVPPERLAAVLSTGFATHAAELYVVSGAAGDAPALPRASAAALAESATRTLAAAGHVSEAVRCACPWLDAVLDRLMSVVGERAEDGPDLLERWAEPDWSVLPTSVPASALRAHLPVWS